MSEPTAPAAPAAAPASAPAAPPTPAAPVLEGAAAVLPGKPEAEMREALAKKHPHAAERAAQMAKLRAEHEAKWAALLKERFGVEPDLTNGGPLIPRARHVELAQAAKDVGYTFYVTVVASHWPAAKTKTGDDPEHFEVATVLRSPGAGSHHASWRVRLEVGEELETLVPLFAGADWQEREQFDLVGVRFAGHPDLRRLMLPDEWEGHPLRKDYAIDTRCVPWR
ncbi:MAG: NADH-quinone oxidoreductase subunit C [Myxococcota bacterium]